MANPNFNPSRIAILVSAFCSISAFGSAVRSDIDYQYFRDFAENKGQFQIGSTNVPIFNKANGFVGTMLNGVPMPDLKAASRNNGVSSLVSKQFINSVNHNTGINGTEFGSEGSNPDSHHFYYQSAHQYQAPKTTQNPDDDYKVHRLKKLVTEVNPIEISNAGSNPQAYLNKNRFSHFVRVGSGIQDVKDKNGHKTTLSGAYLFLTGGVPLKLTNGQENTLVTLGSLFENVYGPMAMHGLSGDSGSPLLAYDRQLNRWVLVGLTITSNTENGLERNRYILPQPDFLKQKESSYVVDVPQVNANEVIQWRNTSNGQSLQASRNTTIVQNGVNGDNKDLHFAGNAGVLQLEESINQGAGGLYFNNSFTVRTKNDNDTWIGSGVVIGDAHTVNWQVKNPEGDRLSKLGAGTLLVNGKGINLGDISVGEGRVVLAQQADAQGRRQAFNQIGLTSGRGTVSLGADNQFNPDNFYFGFRGGRLDLNGRALTFNRIQNTDEGARIVNHNPNQTAELVIQGVRSPSEEDIQWSEWGKQNTHEFAIYEYVNSHRNNRKDYFHLKENGNPKAYFPLDAASNEHWEYLGSDKTTAVKTVLERIRWTKWGTKNTHRLALYEYVNKHQNNRKDYFRLKENGNPKTYFPTDASSNEHWEYLGSNKENAIQIVLDRYALTSAFNGFLGETERNKENGQLNVTYHPTKEKMLMISGGANLNGNLTVENGKLLLSGRPTPHAYDHLNKREVIKDHDWINSEFVATHFNVKNSGTLYVGRNVSRVQGDILGSQNATVSLGFINGKTPTCIRSDYTGDVNCGLQQRNDAQFAHLPKTQINGTIYLHDHAHLDLGKAHFSGKILGYQDSSATLYQGSQWTMLGSSQLFDLEMENGSEINLHPEYNNLSQSKIQQGVSNFNQLHINGNLTGSGQFNFLTNAAQERGDHITIGGAASGNFKLGVKNTGAEPANASPLRLIEFTHHDINRQQANFSLANQFVDLGAYRYVLAKTGNEYRLYSPLKDLELNPLATAPNIDTARIAQLESEIKQKNQELSQVNQQLTTQQNSLTIVRQKLASQEQEKASAQANYNHYQGQLKGRLPVFRINYLKQRRDQAAQQINQAQTQIAQLKVELGEATQNVESLKQTVASTAAQVNSLRSELNALSPTAQAMQATRREAEKLCTQNSVDATACKIAIDGITHPNTHIRSTDEPNESQPVQTETLVPVMAAALSSTTTSEHRISAGSIDDVVETILDAKSQAVFGNYQQADLISQFANSALSELSAQGQNLQQIRQGLQRQLFAHDAQPFNVWANHEQFRGDYKSSQFREYGQKASLTQLGIEGKLTDRVRLGLVFSDSHSRNQFSDAFNGKSHLRMATAYVKHTFADNVIFGVDFSYGKAKNRIQQGGIDSQFRRNLVQAGLSLAKTWQVGGVDIQPTAAVHYNRIGKAYYALDQAQIAQKAVQFFSFQLGMKVAKTWDFDSFKLTPSLQAQYSDASHRNLAMDVNNQRLTQRFGRQMNYSLGLQADFKQWSLHTEFGMQRHSQARPQKHASLSLKYQW